MAQCVIQSCDICETSPRSRYCIECEQYFCKPCERSHLKAKSCKTHTFIDLDEVNQDVKSTKCDVHNERYTYFCETCSCLLCYMCLATAHKKHDFSLVEEIAEKRRSSLESELKRSINEVNEISKTIKCLQDAKKNIESHAKENQSKIKIKQKELIDLVNKAAIGYLETIENESRNRGTEIDLEIEERKTAIEKARLLQERVKTIMTHNSSVAILQTSIVEMGNLESLTDIKEEIINPDYLPSVSLVSIKLDMIKQMFGFNTTKKVKSVKITAKKTRPIQIGDSVRVKSHIREPRQGWAGVRRGSIGIVKRIYGDEVNIDFAEYSNWIGHMPEMELSDPV